jgi:CheY-like chemotaxis protein
MSKPRILVVEDDEAITRLLEVALQEHGFEFICTDHGQEALAICRDQPPDLVVLDIRLPDISGYEVGRALRAGRRTRYIPVVVLTAFNERNDRMIALDEIKARYFLNKPFDVDELIAIIKGQLREHHRGNQFHPITELPTGDMVAERLRDLLTRDDWALAMLRLRDFDGFRQQTGAEAGEQIMRATADLISAMVEEHNAAEDFVGQLSIGPTFVLISTAGEAPALIEQITTRFNSEFPSQFGPTLQLSSTLITPTDGPFNDIRELSAIAEERLR